jgi:hypothetical protein
MTDVPLESALARLAPHVDDVPAWDDVVRRAATGSRLRRRLAVVAVAMLLTAGVVASALAEGPLTGAFHGLSSWISSAPGGPAPGEEQRLLREENARAAAPVPDDTELGLLTSKALDGVRFDLLGFRDRKSLCLRLRSSAGQGEPIIKASADCVSEQLLVDLSKPLAVIAAADPFPRSRSGLQALYGLAADGVSAVELRSEGGSHRVPVTNNAFLYLYRGEGPRLLHNRLEYKSDVPFRAVALDANDNAVGADDHVAQARLPGRPLAKRASWTGHWRA